MALVLVNDRAAIEATICMPRVGAWHADIRVDQATDITGRATISVFDGRLTLTGTVSVGGVWQDAVHLRVVGGGDGLRKTARPKHYNSITARIVLSDLLAAAGEQLAASADPTTLTRSLGAWTTNGMPIGRLVSALLDSAAPGSSWRVLSDGTVWVGPETWPDSGLVEADYQTIDEAPERMEALLGVEAPLLLPGTTLGGRRVSYVQHHVGGAGVRTIVWFESETTTASSDRLKDAFEAVVRGVRPGVDYRSPVLARVVIQKGDTVDVKPDDERIPGMAAVPLLLGLPGTSVSLSAGGRVLVGWDGGDPKRPFAVGWDGETRANKVVLDVPELYAGGETGAAPTIKAPPFLTDLVNILNKVVPPIVAQLATPDPVGAAQLTAALAAFNAGFSSGTYTTARLKVI
jgi:hypothetical protein